MREMKREHRPRESRGCLMFCASWPAEKNEIKRGGKERGKREGKKRGEKERGKREGKKRDEKER